ncbi:E3 SUMO-protein ligase ZBED1-like [Styela clava]
MMNRKSPVWRHFTPPAKDDDERQYVVCKRCGDKLSYHATTSNLLAHIKRRHVTICLNPDNRSDLDESSSKQSKLELIRPILPAQQEKITSLVVDFIVKDMRPLSTIEGTHFKRLMGHVAPNYSLPSRRTITRRVEEEYCEKKMELKRVLENIKHMSLTFDAWTSVKMEAYLGITAHYVDAKFNLCSCVLSVKPLDDRHTAKNICEWVEEVLNDFGVSPHAVCAAVSDNGSNMKAAKDIFHEKFGWASVACAAHTLQLCLNKGLGINGIEKPLAAARRLVQHFKRSELATSALGKKCEEMKLTSKRLIMDVSTRWNSTYNMLVRLQELQWPILAILGNKNITNATKASALTIKPGDWEIFKQLIPVLEPFAEATDLLGGEKYVSISIKNPYIKGLKKHLSREKDDELLVIRQFRQKVKGEMEERFPIDLNDISSKAMALDPRYKLRGLRTVESLQLKSAIELELTVLFEQTVVEKAEPSSSSVQQSTSIISLAFESSESDDSADTEVPVVANEVNKFFSSKVLSECSNPLTWWKEQHANYPNLSKLVDKYMCVTATSTPSERLFSAAGNTATELRLSLTGSHVEALVFLKCNSDI